MNRDLMRYKDGAVPGLSFVPGTTQEEVHYWNTLVKSADDVVALLKEWIETPFFEERDDYLRWANGFQPRAVKVIHSIESLEH